MTNACYLDVSSGLETNVCTGRVVFHSSQRLIRPAVQVEMLLECIGRTVMCIVT